jgi:hypothetical protein
LIPPGPTIGCHSSLGTIKPFEYLLDSKSVSNSMLA